MLLGVLRQETTTQKTPRKQKNTHVNGGCRTRKSEKYKLIAGVRFGSLEVVTPLNNGLRYVTGLVIFA